MEAWIKCGAGFIQADIIRWTESIWQKRGRRKRLLKTGERQIVAEVLSNADKDGWVRLLISRCNAEVTQVGAASGDLKWTSQELIDS